MSYCCPFNYIVIACRVHVSRTFSTYINGFSEQWSNSKTSNTPIDWFKYIEIFGITCDCNKIGVKLSQSNFIKNQVLSHDKIGDYNCLMI